MDLASQVKLRQEIGLKLRKIRTQGRFLPRKDRLEAARLTAESERISRRIVSTLRFVGVPVLAGGQLLKLSRDCRDYVVCDFETGQPVHGSDVSPDAAFRYGKGGAA